MVDTAHPPPGFVYRDMLLRSRFCVVPKGHRKWSPRLLDAVWHGCIPVIVADGWHLPLSSLLPWRDFSLRLSDARIADLVDTLRAIPPTRVATMQRTLLDVRRHFVFGAAPAEFDAFYMMMAEVFKKTPPLP
eukprot:CAMPEP_0177659318 /NCGR_PEP_ID=MMETSP0447-20121125/17377_1 /TAXON_ID=0 /ORGANISM="Stygamoeba regulata, Strain BSH-02190019" /LENGTH=131 /DNA_ID=CAMNT_0019164177 /DNA_START=122 /DNA_END=517 /DNA_ORIENTATION=-